MIFSKPYICIHPYACCWDVKYITVFLYFCSCTLVLFWGICLPHPYVLAYVFVHGFWPLLWAGSGCVAIGVCWRWVGFGWSGWIWKFSRFGGLLMVEFTVAVGFETGESSCNGNLFEISLFSNFPKTAHGCSWIQRGAHRKFQFVFRNKTQTSVPNTIFFSRARHFWFQITESWFETSVPNTL